MLKYLRARVKSTADKYKSNSRKRERLWTDFHTLATSEQKLASLWTELLTNLGLSASVDDDPFLEQSLYTEIHQAVVKEYFEHTHITGNDGSVTKKSIDSILTDELNILRYACGYVARNLLKRYEKQSGEVAQQYVTCLGEMAVEGEGDDVLAYTKIWLEKVNRGGLFPLSDEAFCFFVEIELCVRTYLPQHMLKTQ